MMELDCWICSLSVKCPLKSPIILLAKLFTSLTTKGHCLTTFFFVDANIRHKKQHKVEGSGLGAGTIEEINGVWAIVSEYGAEGGKMQRSEVKVESGKNIGRANETSPFEQACFELRSTFDKKLHQGYSAVTGSGLEKALESMIIDLDIDQVPVVQSVNAGIFATQTASPGSADTVMESNQVNERDTDNRIAESSADSAVRNETILPIIASKEV
eukprot:Nk52_evm2s274 gene=Nk52_evmTU2s274